MNAELPHDPRAAIYGRKSRGAVAGAARKHCASCGRTVPNRNRSSYCERCYSAGIRADDAERKRAARRAQADARRMEENRASLGGWRYDG